MSQQTPMSLDVLTRSPATPPQFASLVLADVNLGDFDPGDLESLVGRPDATALRITSLNQHSFERVVERYNSQFTAVHIHMCQRIEDLTPLESMPQLTHVAIHWNQRSTRLWDFDATPDLVGLHLTDFRRLTSLDDLRRATSLEELYIGDTFGSPRTVFESLDPLSHLANLRSLRIVVKKIEDDRVQPLGALSRLELLNTAVNQWTTEQCAWLRAHLPDGAEGRILEPIWYPKSGFSRPNPKDVRIIGKRKPYLNSTDDADRLARYIERYQALVARYRDDPTIDP